MILSLCEKPLGMPLYADDRKRFVTERFGDVIGSLLKNVELPADFVYRLVVCAVYHKTAGEKGIARERAADFLTCSSANRFDDMVLIACRIRMHFEGAKRHILLQAAAEENVDQLHAFANSEHRLAHADKGFQKEELDAVKHEIDISGGGVWLMKKGRVDVAAARQKQQITALCQSMDGERGDG